MFIIEWKVKWDGNVEVGQWEGNKEICDRSDLQGFAESMVGVLHMQIKKEKTGVSRWYKLSLLFSGMQEMPVVRWEGCHGLGRDGYWVELSRDLVGGEEFAFSFEGGF